MTATLIAAAAAIVVVAWRSFGITVATIATATAAAVTVAVAVVGPVIGMMKSVRSAVTKARGPAEWVRTEVAKRTKALDEAIRKDEVALGQLDAARRLSTYLSELRSPHRYEQYRGLLGRIHQDLKQLSDTLAVARAQWVVRGSLGGR